MGENKTHPVDAFHGFIVASWCCYIRDYDEGELREVFGVGFLYFLGGFLAADRGADVVAAGKEGIEDMGSDKA